MMRSSTRPTPAVFSIGLAVLAIVVAVSSLASTSGARLPQPEPNVLQRSPTVVATVDMVRLFDSLKAAEAADDAIRAKAEELTAESGRRAKELELLEEDIGMFDENSPKYQEALEVYALASLRYKSFIGWGEDMLDFEKSRHLKDLYETVKDAIRELADREGIDVVLVDDSVGDIIEGNEADTMRQLSSRRLMFRRDAIDVTDQLIAMMNQQFGANVSVEP